MSQVNSGIAGWFFLLSLRENDGFTGIAEQDENEYREVYCW